MYICVYTYTYIEPNTHMYMPKHTIICMQILRQTHKQPLVYTNEHTETLTSTHIHTYLEVGIYRERDRYIDRSIER